MILLFLAQIGLVISSIFIVILNFYIQPNNNFLGLNVCIAIISVAYILYFIWKNFSEVLKGWDIKLVYGALSLIFLVIVGTSGTFLHLYSIRDQQKFTKTNEQDAKSKEFGIIQKLGHENDVYIKLGNTRTSWALTRLVVVPDASGASMYLMNGYCALNYSDVSSQDMKQEMIKNISKDKLAKERLDIPKMAIMMHEFAHCIDIKRDYLTFNINAANSDKTTILGTNAIAPKFRSHVKDLMSYQELGSASTLWKEVFADLYMAGYLYVNHPSIADQAVNNWSKLRAKNTKDDEGHSTSCWLNIAQTLPKPRSNNELINWADNIRSTSK
ncbi:TPA: hypothetical protein NJU96_002246, partial [Acinetobacter baumannii]|nr:hypothetical protein [Acinetobacter baumannii]